VLVRISLSYVTTKTAVLVERKAWYANLESALAQIRRYIMSKSDVPTPIDAALHSLEDFVYSDFCKQRKKQSKLTDVFFYVVMSFF